jgi:hypothetical protein
MIEIAMKYWEVFAIPVTGVVAYLFGGKMRQMLENKKTTEEIKISSATAVEGMQSAYKTYVDDDKLRREKEDLKIQKLEAHCEKLQDNFNAVNIKVSDLYMQYSQEVQKNIDWAVMYNDLKFKYETLEAQYLKLKKDFEYHKKKTSENN